MAVKFRIVVVGLGSIGRRHARLLAERPHVAVEWCESSSIAIEAARAELGVSARLHTDFGSMLASGPDAIVIATPHAAHSDQAIAALAAGVHVLCEKPMSDNLASAQRIADAARNASGVFGVGFHLHFHPAIRRVKQLIVDGSCGSIHHVHCHVGTYITLVNSKSRYQQSLPGALFMDYAHQPDLFHHLTGRTPRGVYAAGGQGGRQPLQSTPNFAAVTCDYDEPLITTTLLNYLQAPERSELEVIGDRGWIAVDLLKGRLRIGSWANNTEFEEVFSTDRDPVYRLEHDAFLAAAAGERPAESPADEALISMRVIAAASASLQSRQRVCLPS